MTENPEKTEGAPPPQEHLRVQEIVPTQRLDQLIGSGDPSSAEIHDMAVELLNWRRSAPSPAPNMAALAPKHTGMKVDYSGLLNQARRGLQRDPGIAEMLRQMEEHLSELGQRWYDGDATVVDEFLQLYCIQSVRREVLAATEGSTDG